MLAVAASAALGGRLALLFALAMAVVGSLTGSIHGFGRFLREGAPAFGLDIGAAAAKPGAIREVLGRMVEGLATVLPDLSRFDLSGFVVSGREISGSLLARNGAYAAVYAAVLCSLGCLLFRRREVVR